MNKENGLWLGNIPNLKITSEDKNDQNGSFIDKKKNTKVMIQRSSKGDDIQKDFFQCRGFVEFY